MLHSSQFDAGDGASLARLNKASSPERGFTMSLLLSIHHQLFCVQDRIGWMSWAQGKPHSSLSLLLWHLLSQTSSACCWSRLIRPAAPSSVALLQFSLLVGSQTPGVPRVSLSHGNPLPLSQSRTRLCLMRRRTRRRKRSLRRSYWHWDVTAGCAALLQVSLLGKTNTPNQGHVVHIQHLLWFRQNSNIHEIRSRVCTALTVKSKHFQGT